MGSNGVPNHHLTVLQVHCPCRTPGRRSRAAALIALLATVGVAPPLARAAPKVTPYGASWCGLCKALKGFLEGNGVQYSDLDIDVDADRKRFDAVTGSSSGIPLLLVALGSAQRMPRNRT